MAKEGSTIGGLMDSFGTAVSMSLQYGVPLEVLVNKFSHTRFDPMGYTNNPDIKIAKSVVDYIFRFMGIQFIPGFREAIGLAPSEADNDPDELPPTGALPAAAEQSAAAKTASPDANGHSNGNGTAVADLAQLERAGIAPKLERSENRDNQFARFQSDAPSCDNCGSITVRNGNCYLCHNCGNSMGCS